MDEKKFTLPAYKPLQYVVFQDPLKSSPRIAQIVGAYYLDDQKSWYYTATDVSDLSLPNPNEVLNLAHSNILAELVDGKWRRARSGPNIQNVIV